MRVVLVFFYTYLLLPVSAYADSGASSNGPTFLSVLISWFPMLLLIAVWIYFMKKMGNKVGKEGYEGLPDIYKKLSELVDVHKEILEILKRK